LIGTLQFEIDRAAFSRLDFGLILSVYLVALAFEMIDIHPFQTMMAAEESARFDRAQRRCAIGGIIGVALLVTTVVYATLFVL
jgi:hypothetical protein